jgi:long-chain acyl-CoA synthetase
MRRSAAAIVQGERRINWEELNWETGTFAARLRDLGIQRGDVVAIVLPNCPEFIFAFLATMRLHAIAMPLNPNYTAGEIGGLLLEKPVRALVTDVSTNHTLCQISTDTQVIIAGGNSSFESMPATAERFTGDALYLFTSGSTGSTKRVRFTQQNLFFEALNFVKSTGIGAEDAIFCPVPLYHSYGLCLGMLDSVYTGATLVLDPDPTAPFPSRCQRMLELLREEQIRIFPGVPWHFGVLADMPGDIADPFRDIKWCMSTGDVLPRRTYDRFLARTGRRVRSFYGSTEAGSVSIETGAEEDVELESVGAPLKNVSIAIRDRSGALAPPGETGQIWIHSPVVPPAGYENDADRTREVFRDGWFNSGDLGHVDFRGRLFLSGRKESIINIGSYKVDVTEVEETLFEISGVREAAVVGVELPHGGTTVKAILAISNADRPLPENEIRTFCRQRLAMFKVPRIIQFVPTLPRDPMGKILRKELLSTDDYVNSIRDPATVHALGQIRQVSVLQQRAIVMRMVERQVAAVLDRGEPIPRDTGFVELGIDSFGAIELVTRLELLFGVELPQTFAFDHPTITAATDELMMSLRSK